jgi:hypothetical protein
VNLFRRIQKCLFHIVSRLGRSFQKQQSIRIRKRLSFIRRDSSAMFQIVLVANEENDHTRLRVLFGFFQPPPEMLKGIAPRHIVHEQGPRSASVITPRDTSKALLPRRVPDLQLDLRIRAGNHAGTEFDTNRQIVDGLKALVRKLQQQARLADAYVCGRRSVVSEREKQGGVRIWSNESNLNKARTNKFC